MSGALGQLSLRRQVLVIIGVACGVGLLVSTAAMMLLGWRQFRAEFQGDLMALGRILADQVQGPLAFQDRQGAEELLAALKSKPAVLSAAIQVQPRQTFAHYGLALGPTELVRFPQAAGLRYEGGEAYLAQPIVVGGSELGRLLLRADYRGEWRRLFLTQALVASLVLAGTLGLAGLVALWLQRWVSEPILRLTRAARQIAERGDYSVRVEAAAHPEVGVLTQAFNQMLEQIQARDAALQEARDRLEQRVAERTRELTESLSVLQATLESTADGILVVDLQRRVTHFNQRFAQMWRIPEPVLQSRDSRRMVAHVADQLADPEEFLRKVNALYAQPETECRDVLYFKDGRVFERFSMPQRVHGVCVGRVWSFHDITERAEAQAELQRERDRARQYLDIAPVLMLVLDAEGRIVRLNPCGARLLGWEPYELLGRDWFETCLPAEHRAEARQLFQRLMAGELDGAEEAQHDVLTRSGQRRLIRFHNAVIRDANGLIIGTLSAGEDVTERQRIEDQLRQLSRAVEQSPASIVITDPQGRIQYVNPKFTQVTGYSLEEVLGQNPRILKSGETPPEEYARLWQTITAGGEWRGEFHNRKKNGELFWESAVICPIKDEAGRITAFLGVKEDITARKAAEQQLRDALNFNQTLLRASPVGILAFCASGQVILANEAVAGMFGCPVEELAGRNLQDLPVWRAAGLRAAAEAALAQHSLAREETVLVASSGRVVWLACRFVPFQFQDHAHVLGLFVDVTEQKQAEAALRRSEELFRLIAENATELISLVDRRGVRRYCSPAFKRVLGWEPATLQGTEWHHGVHPEDVPFLREATEEAFRCGRYGPVEYRRQHKDGSWRTLEANSVVVDHAQHGRCLLVVARDVTERKAAEAERQRMELQLRQAQKLESIGRLAAGIAHEINTPTQFIGDNLQFLKDSFEELNPVLELLEQVRAADPQPAHPAAVETLRQVAEQVDVDYLRAEIPKAIAQSQEGVARVTKIVRAMKEFSHPGSADKTPTDLNRALETTLTICRNEWKYVAEVVTEFEPDPPLVPCLPAEMNQVFLNLIVNAAQAIAEKVGDGTQGKGTITIRTRRDGDWFEIRIADTGPGIPEHLQGRIFEPFFTTKPVGKGTGQGLAMARSVVVDKHGGTITFETEVGHGTTFIIRLPIQPAQALVTQAAA